MNEEEDIDHIDQKLENEQPTEYQDNESILSTSDKPAISNESFDDEANKIETETDEKSCNS